MCTWKVLLITSLLFLGGQTHTTDYSKHQSRGIIQWDYEKRPFCNAFTGCGRKRSFKTYTAAEINQEGSHELSDLILNAELSINKLQKLILLCAKIFQGLEEAQTNILIKKGCPKCKQPVL